MYTYEFTVDEWEPSAPLVLTKTKTEYAGLGT